MKNIGKKFGTTLRNAKDTFMEGVGNFAKNKYVQLTGGVLSIGTLALLTLSELDRLGYTLSPEKVEASEWIPFYNENGRIDDCYHFEGGNNSPGKAIYVDAVKKKNNGNLEGDILLPDVNMDKKVGKNNSNYTESRI